VTWFGLVWFGFGLVWFVLFWFGLVWFGRSTVQQMHSAVAVAESVYDLPHRPCSYSRECALLLPVASLQAVNILQFCMRALQQDCLQLFPIDSVQPVKDQMLGLRGSLRRLLLFLSDVALQTEDALLGCMRAPQSDCLLLLPKSQFQSANE
jgi:hypothetical protein